MLFRSRVEPKPSAVRAWSSNHSAAKAFPPLLLVFIQSLAWSLSPIAITLNKVFLIVLTGVGRGHTLFISLAHSTQSGADTEHMQGMQRRALVDGVKGGLEKKGYLEEEEPRDGSLLFPNMTQIGL